jgi:hypothetical protein
MFDFNKALGQRSSDLIPADTVATLQLNIKQGDTGEGLWLKKSKDGRSIGLDCEFTILDAEFKGRKFWSRLTVDGLSDGHKQQPISPSPWCEPFSKARAALALMIRRSRRKLHASCRAGVTWMAGVRHG